MIYQFVAATLHNYSDTSVPEILMDENIQLKYNAIMNLGPTDGRLLISPHSKKIFLKIIRSPSQEQFVILHELGHYFWNMKMTSYALEELYSVAEWNGRTLFAALYLLKNKELGSSIIDYLQLNGCPKNTDFQMYDYLCDLSMFEISSKKRINTILLFIIRR